MGESPWNLTEGRCVIPFSIRFPTLDSRLDLPPTVNVTLREIKVRTHYSVRLKVRRPGFLRHNLTKEKAVLLRVSDSADGISPTLTGTTATAMLPAERLDPHGQAPQQEPYLPKYSPSIQMNLALLSPPILHTGQPLAIDLTASVPEDFLKRLGIVRLRSLYIGLRALTMLRIGSVSRATTSYVEICSLRRDLRINSPVGATLYSFDREMWQGRLVPLTFQSAHISRSYILEVIGGFSCEALDRVEVRFQMPSSQVF